MPFDPHHPVLIACRQLGAAFDSRDAEIAHALGVTRNELRLLNLLEDGPRPQVSVAGVLGLSRSAVTSIADSLTERRLIERSPSTEDRRVKLLSLTPAVWGVLAQHYRPGGERVIEAIASDFPEDAAAALAETLSAIAAAIHPSLVTPSPPRDPRGMSPSARPEP
ncbi:MarR family transcriptional regulator [Microbacterium enclense]|uniref:MarR family transcriptional regulator n=1 Tax=Microbacterium enclense TaxID=993073 RepID=A0A443J5M4_9MICO|nr:MarR family winged helix-turn-helix transcriptional regulator [Microbacterium enclense]RWR15828.1 MarR family transcriptional regulator [Microbacterium enclense]